MLNKGFDYTILVIYKFNKRVIIIPDIAKYITKDWAKALLERFEIADWGILRVIISDRDRKFVDEI